MKILQWTMAIPSSKQKEFTKWFKEVAGPAFKGFGAKKHEIHKIADSKIVGRQTVEKNRFIERVYFSNDFDLQSYFTKVKANTKARKLSRMYESKFGATDIELRVLEKV